MGRRGDAIRRKLLGLDKKRNTKRQRRKREVLERSDGRKTYTIREEFSVVDVEDPMTSEDAMMIRMCLKQTDRRISSRDLMILDRLHDEYLRFNRALDREDHFMLKGMYDRYANKRRLL